MVHDKMTLNYKQVTLYVTPHVRQCPDSMCQAEDFDYIYTTFLIIESSNLSRHKFNKP